jgi:hypothetical protein
MKCMVYTNNLLHLMVYKEKEWNCMQQVTRM